MGLLGYPAPKNLRINVFGKLMGSKMLSVPNTIAVT